jgi:hypothetical protein
MITAVATKSVLIKQELLPGGKRKDIFTKRGEKINLTEEEAIMFWGALDLKEADKKSLLKLAKSQGYKRVI